MVIVEWYLKNIFDVLYLDSILVHDVDWLNDVDEYQLMFELRQIRALIKDQFHYWLEFLI
jgi:hypothetical protein